MAKLPFFFSTALWSASASVPVMKMLADQAEENVARAVSNEMITRISSFGSYDEERYDDFGNCVGTWQRDFFTCGSCYGDDDDEVKAEYKHLITQLTRRSAYLTIFGIFEHRMMECQKLMANLTGSEIKKLSIENCHKLLKKIGGNGIADVNHFIVIRNVMAHSDGVAEKYSSLVKSQQFPNESTRRRVNSVTRALNADCGISISMSNNLIMDRCFLDNAIGEFEQYIGKLENAVRAFHEENEG